MQKLCSLSRKMMEFYSTNIFRTLQRRERANYPSWKYYLARSKESALFSTEQEKRILRIGQPPENPGTCKSDWLNVLAAPFPKEMMTQQNPQSLWVWNLEIKYCLVLCSYNKFIKTVSANFNHIYSAEYNKKKVWVSKMLHPKDFHRRVMKNRLNKEGGG